MFLQVMSVFKKLEDSEVLRAMKNLCRSFSFFFPYFFFELGSVAFCFLDLFIVFIGVHIFLFFSASSHTCSFKYVVILSNYLIQNEDFCADWTK